MSDGAILTGENGVGKTSLIRLIPVFFGELPRRITFGTLSFVEFYLARSTSYIIFEYERRGVVCQSVLYAGGGDETYSYRFIRTAYELGQFAEADGKTLVPGPALTTHLKKLGNPQSGAYSRRVSGHHPGPCAYRPGRRDQPGICVGLRLHGQRATLARITSTESSGMFRRQAEFRDFLRMVVSYISEKADPIAISGDRSKISIWPKHYAAYQSVMQHAPLMEDISRLDARLAANEHEFGVLHAKLLVLINHFTGQRNR